MIFGGQNNDDREADWRAFEREALPFLTDVFRVAQYLVRNRAEAEDLTQETFVQALRSFHRYTPDTNCRAWLVQILYHLNSKCRRKLGQLKLVEDADEQIVQTLAFAPLVSPHVTDEDILQALENIPEQFRRIVLLTDVEEFSYKEVAAVLEIPIGTVMSRLYRGRKLLRGQLADYARKLGIRADES